jgi:hypothetical protein
LHIGRGNHTLGATLIVQATIPIPRGAALRPLALIGLAFGALTTFADSDLWGHLRFGLDIIANRGVITGSDVYSFTADRTFVYHEWLGATILAAVYTVGGLYGLMAIKAVLAITPTIVTWWALRQTQFTWRWLGVGLVAWGTIAVASTLKPEVWTAIGIATLLVILTSGSSRRLWLLPPLFALWTNLHGGWIVGGGILAIWTAVAWFEHGSAKRRLLAAGVASLLFTLLNPYGIDLWRFLMETVRLGRADIVGWGPIWKVGIAHAVMWGLVVALIGASWRHHGRPHLAALVTLALFAFAAARVSRLVPMFAVATVPLLAARWPRETNAAPPDPARALFDGVCVAACVLVAAWTGAVSRCISFDYTGAPDTIAAEALRGTRGRLVTHFDWGEYALWHFGPQLKVSIDGRRETLYSMRTLQEQHAIAEGSPEGVRALERIRPEYVWLPTSSTVAAKWLLANGYREEVRTDRSFVAARTDLPPLTAYTGTSSGCFPGP